MNGNSGAVHCTLRRISSRRDGSSRSARESTTAEAPAERTDRLSQQTTREEPSEPERIEGVEHDQVEVAQPAGDAGSRRRE